MNIKSKKGMTLVEVIATVAIMAVIMVPISLIFTTAYSNFIAESDKSTAQKSARAVLYGKGLYGNGLISYGVMGDLQRSNASGDKITIGNLINQNIEYKGHSISISDNNGLLYRYSLNGTKLEYEYRDSDGNLVTEDYLTEKSSNEREVKVLDFTVEKIEKGTNVKGKIIDNDLIKVSVEVECGQSGIISLESSYRIPIEN